MNFLKKLFNLSLKPSKEKQQPVHLSLDDSFVQQFIQKGGKFLYATKKEEVVDNLKCILVENNWKEIVCTNPKLYSYLKNIEVNTQTDINCPFPFFTTCEHFYC